MGTATAAAGNGEPMMDINTTPLIDVMLVLLIMFIITIPIQTHAVKIDIPQGRPDIIDSGKNKVVVDAGGAVLWNGAAVDLPTLTRYLELTARMDPEPELHLQPDPAARYELVDEVLAVAKRVGVEKMGFVGNERHKAF